jgi:hypothetical protein
MIGMIANAYYTIFKSPILLYSVIKMSKKKIPDENEHLKEWIKDYIETDDRIKKYNDKLKEEKQKKLDIEITLKDYMTKHKLEDHVFNIPNHGALKFTKKSTYSGISKEYLYDRICEILDDPELTQKCINNIYDSREKKEKTCITRSNKQVK